MICLQSYLGFACSLDDEALESLESLEPDASEGNEDAQELPLSDLEPDSDSASTLHGVNVDVGLGVGAEVGGK